MGVHRDPALLQVAWVERLKQVERTQGSHEEQERVEAPGAEGDLACQEEGQSAEADLEKEQIREIA
jgi:hypothetical protein